MTATTVLRIGPADHGSSMTLDEFADAEVEEGYRSELARGILEVTRVPSDPHGAIVWIILRLLAVYDLQHPGVIYRAGGGSEFHLWLRGMMSGRHPDVAVALQGTPPDSRGSRPPSLAFEVVSEGSEAVERDYVTKRAEYLAYGLREYWIVDPAQKIVTVLLRDGDIWVERVVRDDERATSLALLAFTVRVADLWVEPAGGPTGAVAANGA
jgi:Uma2 family endonuclease